MVLLASDSFFLFSILSFFPSFFFSLDRWVNKFSKLWGSAYAPSTHRSSALTDSKCHSKCFLLKINSYFSSFLFPVVYFLGKHVMQDHSMRMRSHIVEMDKKKRHV